VSESLFNSARSVRRSVARYLQINLSSPPHDSASYNKFIV
jgi:hypothetical protein